MTIPYGSSGKKKEDRISHALPYSFQARVEKLLQRLQEEGLGHTPTLELDITTHSDPSPRLIPLHAPLRCSYCGLASQAEGSCPGCGAPR